MAEIWQQAGFGLYIHWPYCQSKCPYCDFNSHVAAAIDQDAWISLYSGEIGRYAAQTGGRVLRSIYFGGGTPNLMQPGVVDAVINAAGRAWSFANDIEITLEANPGSVEQNRFRGYADAGVNRVSLGLQALNDADLRALGRLHSVTEALAALDVARASFGRVSFDLIYARQGQTVDAWRAELGRALTLGPDHLSLYQLTIEDGTAFGDRLAAGKLRGLPDEDLAADLFELTRDMTAAAGLPAYEISNHARDGQQSRHNLIYWQGGDWVGIGPGAHGRLTLGGVRFATETALAPAVWMAEAGRGQGERRRRPQDPREAAEELLMMGLRTCDGVPLDRLSAIVGEVFRNKVNKLRDLGLLWPDANRLRATPRGQAILNALLRDLLPG